MIKFFLNDLKKVFTNPTLIYSSETKEFKVYFSYFIFIQVIFIFLSIINALLFNHFDISFRFDMSKVSFFYIVLVGPLMEELLFRSYLKKSKMNIALFVCGLIYFLLNLFVNNKVLTCSISFLLIPLFYFILVKSVNKLSLWNPYSKNQSLFLVYLSSVSFGIAHIGNYKFSLEIFCVLLIVLIPKIIGGFVFAMYRIKFGIIQSLLLHSFANFMGYSLVKLLLK